MRTKVSFERIVQFLNREEVENSFNHFENDSESQTSILFDNTSFSWDRNEEPFLKKICAQIPSGALVAVIGEVGSGKSAFLSSIVGEMHKLEGDLQINGSLAYVPQNVWIQNETIKNNILFTSDYNRSWYQKVIYSCALIPDFCTFAAGDETEIGENGTNLSGGQKQRISLSRAVYHNSDIYLLDDPLSAVDAQTAKHIFQQVIGPNGLLAKKTRLWVTNNYSLLNNCDSIIVFKNGRIDRFVTFDELKDDKNLINSYNLQHNKIIKESHNCTEDKILTEVNSGEVSGTLIKEEKMKNKEMTFDDGWFYIRNSGISLILLMIITLFLSGFCETASDYWITKWSDNYQEIVPIDGLKVFISLIAMQSILVSVSTITIFYFSTNLSLKLFQQMLINTMHFPMTFFDETPIGRIMTRFSRDLSLIESAIPYSLIHFLQNTIKLLVIYFAVMRLSFYLSLVIAILLLCGYGLHVSQVHQQFINL